MPSSKPTWKRGIQAFAILLILVIFPLLSWYFLQSGFNFTKVKYEQLDSLGQVQISSYPVLEYKTLDTAQMEGNIILAGNLSHINKKSLSIIEGLYTKFDDRNDLLFLFYDNKVTLDSTQNRFTNYTFYKDKEQVKLIDGKKLNEEEFQKSLNLENGLTAFELVLIDSGKEVRGRYDVTRQEERDLLISHIIFLLPKE